MILLVRHYINFGVICLISNMNLAATCKYYFVSYIDKFCKMILGKRIKFNVGAEFLSAQGDKQFLSPEVFIHIHPIAIYIKTAVQI